MLKRPSLYTAISASVAALLSSSAGSSEAFFTTPPVVINRLQIGGGKNSSRRINQLFAQDNSNFGGGRRGGGPSLEFLQKMGVREPTDIERVRVSIISVEEALRLYRDATSAEEREILLIPLREKIMEATMGTNGNPAPSAPPSSVPANNDVAVVPNIEAKEIPKPPSPQTVSSAPEVPMEDSNNIKTQKSSLSIPEDIDRRPQLQKQKQHPTDPKLQQINDDPRGIDPTKRITSTAQRYGAGRNTESFNPASTLVRPDLRVWVASNRDAKFTKPLKHDDVVIIPELFGPESNWDIYYKLIEEITSLQSDYRVKGAEWISWHKGAHLISKNPRGSPTFTMVIDKLCQYFSIRKKSVGTRFNWYRDSSDWKPFHHDSAAYNPQRAKDQNITVGVSFGACRELAFLRTTPQTNGEKCKIYFPQTNNGVFSFGRDVNILWKHGINALAEEEQDGKGRISIILWGLAEGVIEEDGSPELLGTQRSKAQLKSNLSLRQGYIRH